MIKPILFELNTKKNGKHVITSNSDEISPITIINRRIAIDLTKELNRLMLVNTMTTEYVRSSIFSSIKKVEENYRNRNRDRYRKKQTEPQGGTPEWYTEGIQPNEYIQMKLSKRTNLDPYEGYLLGQIIKYASRCDLKDEKGKDAVKIQYYASKLLEYQNAGKEKE